MEKRKGLKWKFGEKMGASGRETNLNKDQNLLITYKPIHIRFYNFFIWSFKVLL